MKIVLALAILSVIIFSSGAYGQTAGDLGYRVIPNKIMENTEGVIEVYAVGDTGSNIVEKLIATSSDSSIIKILGTEQDKNGFVTNVKIKASGEGIAKIAIAAPGFSSQEFQITVYKNSNIPAKLLLKTTPSTFMTTGPRQGYAAVELTNNDGFPIPALDDTVVTLSASDNNIVNLKNTQLVIKKGDYFAIGQFEIKQNGNVQISAASSSMQTVSSSITISTTASNPSTIQVYVYPNKITSSIASYAYVVVQLHDSSGIPVQAKEDIPVNVQVTNSSGTELVHTSGQSQLISANSPLIIKKGSYWGYIPVAVNAGLTGIWNVDISAKGYQVSGPAQLSTVSSVIFDVKTAKVDLLPILATGQKELIGILHLQDNDGNPVLASQDIQIVADSSDSVSLSVDAIKLNKADSAIPVFGTVEKTTQPNQVTLNVVTEPPQTITPTISPATTTTTLQLVTDPLIPKVLSHTDFPLSLYMSQDGALAYSIEDLNPLISPIDFIQSESKVFPKGQSLMILDSNLLKEGTNSISVTAGSYVSGISLQSLSSKPAALLLDHSDKLLSNVKNTFSIELLDSQQLPVFADNDMEFKLVSNDPSVLNVPESVVIKKGTYYSFFDTDAKSAGKAEISVLTSELPLSKFDVDITSLTPEASISSTDFVDSNSNFDATVTVQYHAIPLSGLKVDWKVQGGKIQNMDSMTNKDGKAMVSLISDDPNKVSIEASVSGGAYDIITVNKDITVKPPLNSESASVQSAGTNTGGFSIAGINPLFIVIPVAIAVGGIVLKKKNMLDGITEKLPILEKVIEIKERLTQLREK
ncbi:MAG TPA: hypothetical protein VFG24_06975 [Nitrosopumilaceae archaeon]|nr:hypothetical protein [Nitrosopumilaceae archaeon]